MAMLSDINTTLLRAQTGWLGALAGAILLGGVETRAQVVINEVMAANATAVANAGEFPDWIELYNTTVQSQSLAGMSLSDDPAVPTKYVFPAGTSLPAHSFLVVWCDHATTSPGLHTGFGLSAAGHTLYLHTSAAAGGGLLDSLTVGPQAENYSVGRVPDGTGSFVLNAPTPAAANQARTPAAAAGLVVNEWLASSSPGTVDWFELYNPATNPIVLSGCLFSLQTSSPTNVILPPLSFIGPQQFIQFFADKLPTNGPTHLDFKLSAAGGTLTLFAPDRVTVIEKLTYGGQVRDLSQGYLPDGNRANVVSFTTTPTPGASNRMPLGNGILINEVLAHTDLPLEDAVEVYNPTAQPVDLGGLYLSNSELEPKKFLVPAGTMVPAGGYAVFYEYQFNPSPGSATSFTFNSAHGDHAWLTEVDPAGAPTGYRTGVGFGASENGVSFGRFTTSAGDVFVALSSRTFGADAPANITAFRSGKGAANVYPKIVPIVINEVMYHPPDVVAGVDNVADEFVELRNITSAAVLLYDPAAPANRWKLATAVDFTFPATSSLPAGGFALVVSFDPATNAAALAAFKSKHAVPSGVEIYGPYAGKLSNRADDLELLKPDSPQAPPHPDAGFVPYIVVDQVAYGTTALWPTNADGLGSSLQRHDASRFGNDSVNWAGAAPTAGRDNGLSFRLDLLGLEGTNVVLQFAADAGLTYSLLYRSNPNAGGWSPLQAFASAATNRTIQFRDPVILGAPGRFYRLQTP